MKIGHARIDRAHFRVHVVCTVTFPVGTVVPVLRWTPWCVLDRNSQLSWAFPWISCIIFVHTPMERKGPPESIQNGEHPGDHNHQDFPPKVLQYKWEAYCNTNGGRTAIQMGGVLTAFPFPQSIGAPKALQYKLEAYCNTNGRRIAILLGEVVRAATLQKCGSEHFSLFFSAKGLVKFGVKFW